MALGSQLWELVSVHRNPGGRCAALSTSASLAVEPQVEPVGNAAVMLEFTSGNPGDLELSAVARKEWAWGTVRPSPEFWHRLRVVKTQHPVEAISEHRNGQVVVSASTREWAIKKSLYRTRNVDECWQGGASRQESTSWSTSQPLGRQPPTGWNAYKVP
ncbi:Hypothetical predicted protein [Marmota monax]|uniref:39S ribosomal protein L18, mitochondrial n=1 Tax=Marmota monax TaxID=9995 RepID=A0A5E4D654_MARMO|nr:hypothetical protein GHT09_010364 [Marmota monax]VTJ89498.1 Hypothetical predicted protein [Marmota monax]